MLPQVFYSVLHTPQLYISITSYVPTGVLLGSDRSCGGVRLHPDRLLLHRRAPPCHSHTGHNYTGYTPCHPPTQWPRRVGPWCAGTSPVATPRAGPAAPNPNPRARQALYRLYLGSANGVPVARVWARQYSKHYPGIPVIRAC